VQKQPKSRFISSLVYSFISISFQYRFTKFYDWFREVAIIRLSFIHHINGRKQIKIQTDGQIEVKHKPHIHNE